MAKIEKIKFEKLNHETGHEELTESEILDIVGDVDKLALVLKDKRMEFLVTLFTKISSSREFRDKVVGLLKSIKEDQNEK